MPKTKTKKIHGSTTDLVIGHARSHLIRRPHLLIRESLPDSFAKIFSPLIFGLAGLVVIAAAIQIMHAADLNHPNFVAQSATDYAAQREFYAASPENLHAAAEASAAVAKVHAAAVATEMSRVVNVIGVILLLGGLFYLHQRHNIFRSNRAGFRIRKIR
ncbi:MAG: hypothetical protein V2A63_03945 [Patescibacteria group bacterium]